MKISIVEDNPEASELLNNMILRVLAELGTTAEITSYKNGVLFLQEYTGQNDIVFLDCEMPMMNGMEVAQKLRKEDKEVIIIFVTNLAQYAVDGYEVGALDYILKPLKYPVFARKFKRALRKIESSNDEFISIKSKRSIVKAAASEVYYVEAMGHNVTFYTANGEILSRSPLSELEATLALHGIVRCASCYMVNLMHVKKVLSDTVVLTNGTMLALTRTKKKEFMKKLAGYINRVI